MRAKTVLALAVVAAAAVALGACSRDREPRSAGPSTAAADPPLLTSGAVSNVLLITIDTLRADVLGSSGGAHVAETPNLDRLAAAGRIYDFAHAHNVVTLPSHVNILTGRYPFEHGVRENSGFVLAAEVPTVASHLRRAGFATAAVVGAFPLDARYGLGRDFDLYDDRYPQGSHPTEFVMPERRGDEVVELGWNWWRQRQGEKRFLWLHLYDPHTPYEPPEPWASRYASSPYLGEVAAVDGFLAPALSSFLAGSEAPTLIVVTGDHGEALGEHGESTHGFLAYEATLRVPLILWAPGLAPGRTDEPARHVDILPTILEAAGVPIPEGLPGRSLLRPLAGGAPDAGASSYFEALSANLNRGWAPLRGVLAGRRKMISVPIPELYDLELDPAESDNLAGSDRESLRALARLLPAESVWPPEKGMVSAEEEQRLQSLGYLSGSGGERRTYTERDDPKNLVHLDNRLHEVVELYHHGRLDEAEREVREVIAERPEMPLGHTFLAQVLLQKGELDPAIEVMQRAQASGVASPSLVRQLGLSLAEAGRAREAAAVLGPLADLGDPDVLNALGLVLSEAGRQADAEATLQRVFTVEPDNPVTRQHLALVALRRSDWTAARDEARRALELNGDLTLAWNYLGTALYNLGDKAGAADALGRAVESDPENWDALYNLAVVALEIQRWDQARPALERFVAGAPQPRYEADVRQARAWLQGMGR